MITSPDELNYNKILLIDTIRSNWNKKLTEKFKSPKFLFNLTIEELIELKENIINKKFITTTELDDKIKQSDNNTEEIQTNTENVQTNDCDRQFLIDKNAVDTLEELKSKHLSNEAVTDIRFDFDDEGFFIVFDVICDTEIQSVLTYNGYRLKYNKICSINNDDENITEVDDSNVDTIVNNDIEYTSQLPENDIDNKLTIEKLILEQIKFYKIKN